MASLAAIFGDRRRLLLSAIIFAILAAFLLLYYFHHLPNNRRQLNDYGFRLLDRMKLNIEERDATLRRFFLAAIRNTHTDEKTLLRKLATTQKNRIQINVDSSFFCKDSSSKIAYADSLREWAFVYDVRESKQEKAKQEASVKKKKKNSQHTKIKQGDKQENLVINNIAIEIDDLIGPCIKYRNELFSEYLVFAKCRKESIPVYQFPLEGVSEHASIDSVIPTFDDTGMPGNVDVDFRGDKYHMFFITFEIDRQELVLCGLIERNDYEKRASAISITVIKRFIMIVLIVLICFPFLKLFFLSKEEQVRISDFIFIISTFFAGTAIISLIIIDSLLESGTEIRTKKNLQDLNQQISRSIHSELEQTRKVLALADSMVCPENAEQLTTRNSAVDKKARTSAGKSLTDSAKTREDLSTTIAIAKNDSKSEGYSDTNIISHRDLPDLPVVFHKQTGKTSIDAQKIVKRTSYTYFDRMAWVSESGWQRLKAQTDDSTNVWFTHVQDRDYFQSVIHNSDSAVMGFDPVYTWTGAEFRVIISKRSRCDTLKIVTLSTQMYSLVDVIMPAGYGYCLTDAQGNVLTHSSSERNRRENILDETENLSVMREAMNARQPISISRVFLYGDPHSMYVSPLKNSSLYLFTFYNRNFGLAATVRILSFVLVFTAMYCLLLILLRLIIHRKRKGIHFLPALDHFELSTPSRRNFAYFQISRWVFPSYSIPLIFLAILYPHVDDYVVISLLLLSPLNIIWLLYSIREWQLDYLKTESATVSKTPGRDFRVFIAPSFIVIFTLFVYFAADISGSNSRFIFLIFQFVVIGLGCAFHFNLAPLASMNIGRSSDTSSFDILRTYSQFLIGSVLAISILPICLFTWYAHNHELVQQIKKSQFNIAKKYFERENRLKPLFDSLGNYAYDTLRPDANLTKGIYVIHNDFIVLKNDARKIVKDRSERLYQSIAMLITGEYPDPLGTPALTQYSSDSCWYFVKEDKMGRMLIYDCPGSPVISSGASTKKKLIIESFIDRYQIMSNPLYGIPIIVCCLLVLYAIYTLIKASMYRLFGYRHLSYLETNRAQEVVANEFFEKCINRSPYADAQISAEMIRKQLQDEYEQYPLSSNNVITNDQEIVMMGKIRTWKAFYECLWNKTTEDEKLVLADLAQDGLMNFRQTETITTLIRKGLIVEIDSKLHVFSHSFRNFLTDKIVSPEGAKIREKIDKKVGMSSVRTPILIALFAVGVFLFLTQEQTFQKLSGMIASITSIIPILVRFFSQQHESKN